MSSGNNNMYFGSNIDGSGNFQSNEQGFFPEGVGERGEGQNGDCGNHRIIGVDEHMKHHFYLPYPYIPPPPPPPHPHPQLQFPPPPFPHPIPVISWGPDNHMYPGGHQQQSGSNHNGTPTNQRMTVGGSNNEWWSDAPMPPNDEDVFNHQSSSSQASENAASIIKNEPTTPRTPFTPQNEAPMNLHPVTEQQQAPYTPNPADIRNLERLNLNPAPVEVASAPRQDNSTIRRGVELRAAEEPGLVVVQCPLNTAIQSENLDTRVEKNWISVQYFAGIESMMKTFRTSAPSFVINASNKTAETECGLELFAKVVPNQAAITCRGQIGAGLRITKLDDGTVWLTVLTDCPIFIISPFKNMVSKMDAFTICRYRREARVDENFQKQEADEISFKIFDEAIYLREMTKLLSEPNGLEQAAQILPALCCTRVSFVKGFGGEYPRQAITQCPCWVDIKLIKQMADLDRLCRSQPSQAPCGSRS